MLILYDVQYVSVGDKIVFELLSNAYLTESYLVHPGISEIDRVGRAETTGVLYTTLIALQVATALHDDLFKYIAHDRKQRLEQDYNLQERPWPPPSLHTLDR